MSEPAQVPRFTINVLDRANAVGQEREFGPFVIPHGEQVEVGFPWHEDDGTVTVIPFVYDTVLGLFDTQDGSTVELVESKPSP